MDSLLQWDDYTVEATHVAARYLSEHCVKENSGQVHATGGQSRRRDALDANRESTPRDFTEDELRQLRAGKDLMLVDRPLWDEQNPGVPLVSPWPVSAKRDLSIRLQFDSCVEKISRAVPHLRSLVMELQSPPPLHRCLPSGANLSRLTFLRIDGGGQEFRYRSLNELPLLRDIYLLNFHFKVDPDVGVKASSALPRKIQNAGFSGNFDFHFFRDMPSNLEMKGLVDLQIAGNFLPEPGEMQTSAKMAEALSIFFSPMAPSLERLVLENTATSSSHFLFDGSEECLALIRQTKRLPHLTQLSLTNCVSDSVEGRQSLASFLTSCKMPQLTELFLHRNGLKGGFLAIASRKYFPRLQTVSLAGNQMEDQHLSAIEEGSARGLQSLILSGNPLGMKSFHLLHTLSDELSPVEGLKFPFTIEPQDKFRWYKKYFDEYPYAPKSDSRPEYLQLWSDFRRMKQELREAFRRANPPQVVETFRTPWYESWWTGQTTTQTATYVVPYPAELADE